MRKNKVLNIILALMLSISAFLLPQSVQAVPVEKQYINQNRSYTALSPIGLVIHDTDAEGGTAQNNRDYFNRVYVAASAHYFVDWNKAIETVPENEKAWHAGPTANRRYLSIEMCMPYGHNQEQFNKVYQNTVELAADMCRRYGWSSNNIVSHYWCSETFRETDHEDPIAFLQQYGKTWTMLLNDIQRTINGQIYSPVTTKPAQTSSDSSISTLQNELNHQGFGNLAVDNIAGPRTLGACPTIKQGAQGNITSWVQSRLGISADGIFGGQTRQAVIDFQKAHGLDADGVIGRQTWRALIGL